MVTYLSAVLSGTAEPFWPHCVLISISVLASFAVAGGIIFESPKYSPATHRVATWLVIGGVAVEALCMVSLFAFDEAISSAQQEKIIALETKLAPRTLSRVSDNTERGLEGLLSDRRGVLHALKSNRGEKALRILEHSAALTESLPPDVFQLLFRDRCGVHPRRHHRT
jgi:hypothetical protein